MDDFFPHLLYGADYNPEQWLDTPEVLEQDVRLMKQAGVNCVSLGIFSWSKLEPQEGCYNFAWLRAVMDRLWEAGIHTILATPSGARPAWMAQQYPEVLRVDSNGQRRHFGGRHNHCYTSPIYREKVSAINQALARELGNHPGVLLWHLSNEYGGACYCPLCQEAFRRWLQARYGTLDTLNHAWWADFWNHRYTDWQQIEPPFTHGEQELPSLFLDWQRFVTHQTVDFCAMEKAAVRAGGSALPVTTNMMEFYQGLDYFQFRNVIDIASWDSYPRWTGRADEDMKQAAATAFFHDLMRCLKQKPFLLMESTPSTVNWRETSQLKKPGMLATEALLAVAHGARSVQYFQWRKSRGGFEKFHGAVVGHDGRNDTRVFGEVAELGRRLEGLSSVRNKMPTARVALVYSWENAWSLQYSSGPRNAGIPYQETLLAHYQALWQLGVAVDIVNAGDPLEGYALVAAPLLYLQDEALPRQLAAYVENGGTLVAGCLHGVVGSSDLCHLGDAPHEQTGLLGLRVEEIDGLPDGEENNMQWQGKTYALHSLCERVVLLGAEAEACYGDDFYRGEPAFTRHHYGAGQAYYLASVPAAPFYTDFYAFLISRLRLPRALNTELPSGVVAALRGSVLFVQNFTSLEKQFSLPHPLSDRKNGELCCGGLTLAPYETRMLTADLFEPGGTP